MQFPLILCQPGNEGWQVDRAKVGDRKGKNGWVLCLGGKESREECGRGRGGGDETREEW